MRIQQINMTIAPNLSQFEDTNALLKIKRLELELAKGDISVRLFAITIYRKEQKRVFGLRADKIN